MGLTSRLGAFLDPVADKLIVAVALVLLVSKDRRITDPHWVLVLSACVIIGREIAISALREWMAELGERTRVAVSPLGKLQDHPADGGPVLHAVPLGRCSACPMLHHRRCG